MEPIQSFAPSAFSSGLATETREGVISSDFETFLKMLTVQMENQDPLNPTDAGEYAMQLATFSGVEQQVLTNDLLEALMIQMGTTGMAQMASWVGKDARATMPAYFDGSPITVAPNPALAAARVELGVTDRTGAEVGRQQIPVSADPIDWAGTDATGAPLPNGTYKFTVISFDANGEVMLEEPADVYATVQEVRSEGGQTILILEGGHAVLASQVSALRDGGT